MGLMGYKSASLNLIYKCLQMRTNWGNKIKIKMYNQKLGSKAPRLINFLSSWSRGFNNFSHEQIDHHNPPAFFFDDASIKMDAPLPWSTLRYDTCRRMETNDISPYWVTISWIRDLDLISYLHFILHLLRTLL